MTESSRDRSRLLGTLLKVKHRKLSGYVDDVLPAAKSDPELFAHLIAWNELHGKIRDTKVAFPILALRSAAMEDRELTENAMSHLALLGPRELSRAYQFNKELSRMAVDEVGTIRNGQRRLLQDVLQGYLLQREASKNWWTAAVIRNRKAMKDLYAVSHLKPSFRAQRVLFDRIYASDLVFDGIKKLRHMKTLEAGGFILRNKIPFTVAAGAGVKLDDPTILLALVQSMTGNELITAAAQLSKLKSFKVGAVQEAYKEAVGKVSKDKRVSVGKVSRAIEAVEITPDSATSDLVRLKEKAAQAAGSIKGDWVILADRSSSMEKAVEASKEIASLLAHRVENTVHLIFFNDAPRAFDVTGKTLDEIQHETRHIRADGTTSIGCGLSWMRDHNFCVDGIILVSDGGENHPPFFHDEYKWLDNKPALIYLKLNSALDVHYRQSPGWTARAFATHLKTHGISFQEWDLENGVDMYALENIVRVIKPGTYGLLDEVLDTPLVLLKDVFGEDLLFPGQIMQRGVKVVRA